MNVSDFPIPNSTNTVIQFPTVESEAEFKNISKALFGDEVSRVGQKALKENKGVGVQLENREIAFYSRADYDKIVATQKLFHEFAYSFQNNAKLLEEFYDSLTYIPELDRETLTGFKEAVELSRERLNIVPEHIRPLLKSYDLLAAIDAKLDEYNSKLVESEIKRLPIFLKRLSSSEAPPPLKKQESIEKPTGDVSEALPPVPDSRSTLPAQTGSDALLRRMSSVDSEAPVEEEATPKENPEVENDPRVVNIKESIANFNTLLKKTSITDQDLLEFGLTKEDVPKLIQDFDDSFKNDGIYSDENMEKDPLVEAMGWYTKVLRGKLQLIQFQLQMQTKM